VGNGFIESRTGFTSTHFGIDDRLLLRCARAGLSLRCAGADWCEPALVTVAEKPDAAAVARKAPAFNAVGGEGKNGRVEAINGVSSNAVEEPVPVALPFAPLDQSLVHVDRTPSGSKVQHFYLRLSTLRACLAALRLLQKRLRLWLLRWSGFFDGAEAVLKNVWQNGFT
jgi:hypothetical protein